MTSADAAKAFVKAQAAFKPALKDTTNPHFKSKFVSLQGVLEAVETALHTNGFAILQPTRVGEDGRTIVITTLMHESGDTITGEYPVTASGGGPQGEGSGLTYARRYALMALLGIAPEDDDGNAAQAGAPNGNGTAQAAAPARETPAQVRARVAAAGRAKNLTPAEIADDFATWSQGTKIGAADVPTLWKYIDYLKTNGASEYVPDEDQQFTRGAT